MRRGIYPGSFDPVTFGHIDIIKRAAKQVDELIVGVLNNNTKTPLFLAKERVKMLNEVTKDIPNVKVIAFQGLLVDFAKEVGATMIIRGLRAISDFEYELQMAQTNHKLYDQIETVFLFTSEEFSYVSSSLVREVATFGGDISQFVPPYVVEAMKEKTNKGEYKKNE
ncbi:MAG TPA: pantetheine-phosphate adenylyltransferase [Candidatus Dorea intestinavium]|nr:pantetheine-phosphate adenylyltransferase [Candidatus Dorea intestinavium]